MRNGINTETLRGQFFCLLAVTTFSGANLDRPALANCFKLNESQIQKNLAFFREPLLKWALKKAFGEIPKEFNVAIKQIQSGHIANPDISVEAEKLQENRLSNTDTMASLSAKQGVKGLIDNNASHLLALFNEFSAWSRARNGSHKDLVKKFKDKEKRRIKRAKQLADKIVQMDNIYIEMKRHTSPAELRALGYFDTYASHPTEGVIRSPQMELFWRLIANIEEGVASKSRRDLASVSPKHASLRFLNVPEGIEVEKPYSGTVVESEFGSFRYKIASDDVLDRSLLVIGDAGAHLENFFAGRDSLGYEFHQAKELGATEAELVEIARNEILNSTPFKNMSPLSDLTALKSFVFHSLHESDNTKISMPKMGENATTFEVMIWGLLTPSNLDDAP